MRSSLVPAASLALLSACASSSLSDFPDDSRPAWEHRAARSEMRTIEAPGGLVIELEAIGDDVVVTEAEGDRAVITAHLEVLALSDRSAREGIELVDVALEQRGERWVARLEAPDPLFPGAEQATSVGLGFEVQLPAGSRVVARSDTGDVEVRGAFARCQAESHFGSIAIEGTRGDAFGTSRSGDVRVADTQGGRLVLETLSGSIRVDGGLADVLAVSGRRADVTLEDVHAGALEVHIEQAGSATLRRATGSGSVRTDSGDVHVEAAGEVALELVAGFGSVTVRGASGELDIRTNSGGVDVSDFAGAIAVDSGYGNVDVDARLARADVRSGDGDVRVTVREGSDVEGEWMLRSSLGDLRLAVPDGFGWSVQARTGSGSIRCEPPIAYVDSDLPAESNLVGDVGGGGGRIRLLALGGDIEIVRAGAGSASP